MDSVACVTNDEYKSLKEVEKTGKLPINNSLDRLIKNGFLKETVIHEIEHPETHNIKTLSEHYLNELVLQVTKQCNLRCKYCAYSGNYYNREVTLHHECDLRLLEKQLISISKDLINLIN